MKYHSLMKFMSLALEADVLQLAVETASLFLEHARRVQQSHLRRPTVTRLFKNYFYYQLVSTFVRSEREVDLARSCSIGEKSASFCQPSSLVAGKSARICAGDATCKACSDIDDIIGANSRRSCILFTTISSKMDGWLFSVFV